VYFELLHSRLVEHLRGRVKSGEITERSLARLAGISQPHLHNVLKGIRVLSSATADTVLTNLHLGALDLLRVEELAGPDRPAAVERNREVPLAAGSLGPAHPFPNLQEIAGRLMFTAAELEGILCPVAVRLAADPNAPPMFRAGDIVLLEFLPSAAQTLEPGAYYAIEAGGCGLLRGYERPDNGPADPVHCGEPPVDTAWVVRAKAIWIGRYLQARPNGTPPA
jgi:hypothetical protein